MEDSKGYVKKINDQTSEIIDIRNLVKSKK